MIEPELLANILRKHRKAAGLSQLQLAQLAGIGKTAVFELEKGKETVQLDTLRKVLAVLNIKVILTSQLMKKITDDTES
ncbi:MAG: helix-turn-helix domain-containing [Bacteroidetes bacterium]|nr:MAG: helix-turn-helix domain-containing [Bacteroidota bacterium]